ncbi:predicted RNA-binding protein [Methanothermobacter sp. MT-2]|nr:predicted RNA-binding protein [Methanothermobacter sp. MT-2]
MIEEFVPAEGTYEEKGEIKSLFVGEVTRDEKNKRIKVTAKTETPPMLKEGTLIIGEVIEVKGQRALVRIHQIKGSSRGPVTSFMGAIHISQVTNGYLSKLTEAFRIGDIVEARVSRLLGVTGIDLQTMQVDLGVIKAMCTRCRHFMKKAGKNEVICPNCENREKRKLSRNYRLK